MSGYWAARDAGLSPEEAFFYCDEIEEATFIGADDFWAAGEWAEADGGGQGDG